MTRPAGIRRAVVIEAVVQPQERRRRHRGATVTVRNKPTPASNSIVRTPLALLGRLSMSRAATDRALWVALWVALWAALWVVPACGSPDWPGGPVWQWFLSPKPHPGRHPASPVVVEVLDGTVV